MQTLNTTGFLFTEVSGEWSILSADFGDGHEMGALVGDPQGTRAWSIRIDALPHSIDLEASFLLTEPGDLLLLESGDRILLESDATQASYLWGFFRVSKAANDEPFWIEVDDPDDGTRKKYLASFVDHRLTYTVLCAQLYSTGLRLIQRRLRDVVSPVMVM